MTVQIPIYTEPFEGVIRPALDAARAAAERYQQQTGQPANLVLSDDGLLVLSDNDLEGFVEKARNQPTALRSAEQAEVLSRVDYYQRHGVTWVARAKPRAGHLYFATQRAGKFKKASNLNHTFRLEAALEAQTGSENRKLLEPFRHSRWGGEVRIGEIILQLDKDSITNPEVILATIPEFLADEELAYTQHAAYPTNEAENYFAMIIGYFTRLLYDMAIPARAMIPGMQVPVMGHNLFIRKSVIVEVGLWGEESVCEDLDFMLAVHVAGYHGKFVAYPGLEFGEAVTRVYAEELEKFRRYAYGAAEAILNPVAQWERSGIFKPSFRRYRRSQRVEWFHVVDLMSFFCSLINLATILPMALAVALGWIPAMKAVVMLCFSTAIFSVLGSLVIWRVRRGRMSRLTHGELWQGWRGAARVIFCQLGIGFCFLGYGVAVLRGAIAYLRGANSSFAATKVDDLDRVSLLELLRRMRSSHLEALAMIAIVASVLWVGKLPLNELGYESLLWTVPCALHATLPYLMNPFLFRKIAHGFLGLLGFSAPVPQLASPAVRRAQPVAIRLVTDARRIAGRDVES